MKRLISSIASCIILIGIGGCGIGNKYEPEEKPIKRHYSKVEIQTLINDSLLNVRALEVIPEAEVCVFLTSM